MKVKPRKVCRSFELKQRKARKLIVPRQVRPQGHCRIVAAEARLNDKNTRDEAATTTTTTNHLIF